MRTNRVDAGLGSTCMLRYSIHARDLSERIRHQFADTKRFVERGAGDRRDVQNQMAFAQIRQEGPAEKGSIAAPAIVRTAAAVITSFGKRPIRRSKAW